MPVDQPTDPVPASVDKKSIDKSSKVVLPAIQMDLNVLLKFIKPFDGSRDQLNPFINNCSSAYNLATPDQKHILFKYILSQLQGKAETACSIKEFSNWAQLKDFLTTQFGERKCYAHLLTDLQECKQLANENVTQYSLRLETCLSQLLTEINLLNIKQYELPGRTAAMNDLALHTFILGLQPRISNNVRVQSPKTLNHAINIATSEERILQFMRKTHEPNKFKPSNVSGGFRRPDYQPRPSYNFEQKPQVFQNKPQVFQNKPQVFPVQCRYCKAPGHTIDNCRKREYNNRRFQVPPRENPMNAFDSGVDEIDTSPSLN